jgi:hypothetical protein
LIIVWVSRTGAPARDDTEPPEPSRSRESAVKVALKREDSGGDGAVAGSPYAVTG